MWLALLRDGFPGWWAWVIVKWGKAEVEGIARRTPFETQEEAESWLREQFGD